MFVYYLKLGILSLRRNPALTALMVITLAIGVAASISTLTILHIMSGNPIPHKSNRLIVPVLDNGPARGYVPGEPSGDQQMSYKDAALLLKSGQGQRRTALYGIYGALESARADLPVEGVEGLAVGADYFSMFEVPFLNGTSWTANEDNRNAKVVVLSLKKSEALVGKDNPVGRTLRVFGQDFQIVGVLNKWNPAPRYTHLINGNGGSFAGEDGVYIPFNTAINLQMGNNGSMSCNSGRNPGFQGTLDLECTWIQFWFELGAASDRAKLLDYLDGYTREQHKLGRFERQAPNKVFDVMQWMQNLNVVDNDTRLAVWLAFGFLLLCLINTVGLLLAKFSARAGEVGVRRALGASKGAVFQQFLIEAGVIGVIGGVLGLLLSLASLALIATQSKQLSVVARMDWQMLALTVVLALVASLLAGLLPTWRACQITPAIQLKSQ